MEMNNSNYRLPRKRRAVWPYLIVGLLVAHVTGMVIAVTITERDKTFLVVPNYYDKAQHWDAEQAERRASVSLGWNVLIDPAGGADAKGNRRVKFTVTDAQGHVLPESTLQVGYFHHAHPNDQLTATPILDGTVYLGVLSMPYAGVWEFHSTVTSGGKTFTQTKTTYVLSQKQMDAAEK